MASWILIPCLVSLRDEFNRLSPGRDKASDGAVGDAAHAAESSDHEPDDTPGLRTPYTDADNIPEVHAIDVDNNLRKSDWSMDRCVEIIVARHRKGTDDRLQNIIYNRRIWSRSWGWTPRAYTGASAHTEHAHFSARYGSGTGPSNPENDTRPWGLLAQQQPTEEDDMAGITQDDFNARMDAWWLARMSPTAADNKIRAALWIAPWEQLVGRTGKSTHEVLFRDMYTMLQQAAGDDAATIIAGVLAGLNPQQIADAVAAAMPADEAKKVADEIAARMAA